MILMPHFLNPHAFLFVISESFVVLFTGEVIQIPISNCHGFSLALHPLRWSENLHFNGGKMKGTFTCCAVSAVIHKHHRYT